jgi:predicted metal-dependent hydrolase
VQRAARQLGLFADCEEPGDTPGFSVRESARARRLSIRVYPRGRVEVVVPRRTRAADVQAFVEEHRDWIAKSRASFARELPPEPFMLPNRISLPAVGREYRVRYERRSEASTVRYRNGADTLVLSGRTGEDKLCVAALKRWLASVAKRDFEPRLRQLAVLTDSPYKSMHVRGQKTCWGSHSARGTISINYCLLFLRPELLRYLMIHELCHAHHMNHSRRFWQRVARYEPDYRALDKDLSNAWQAIPAWLGMY